MRETPAAARALSILHVTQPTDGGVGRVVALLVRDQVGRGCHVSVASPPGPLAEEIEAEGATWLPWPARRSPGVRDLGEVGRLRRIIKSANPDVVHLHSSKAGFAGRWIVRGRVPTIFQPHAWSFHAVGGILGGLSTLWERAAARWATTILCVSDAERAEGEAAGIRAAWRVIPNGVDTIRVCSAGPAERSAARSQLGISADVPLAVCVGRLSVQKGQDVLLLAWPLVRGIVPSAQLVLVGDGPLREHLERDIPEGAVLVGRRDDVEAWFAAADVTVLPSRWEGMSLTLLEAMACGRSVVAADVAGARDALGQFSAAIVPVEAPAELAAAICVRLEDSALAAAEGAANRVAVEERFSLEQSHGAIADLTNLLGGCFQG